MKKTLIVNLNNIVFNIDDDAYEMLQTYLHEIAEHFQSEEEKKEIMNDVEARIAELFTEKLQRNKNVVNLTDVQELIEIMGKPSQYADENADADEEAKSTKSDKKKHKSRRFYRDPENAILGGVAGGLAAYFSLDVTLIRIILVVLVFVGVGFIIPIYLLAWLIVPQAVSASQRLEMQGEDVTVDSIKTELNNAKSYVESDKFKQSATSIGVRLGEIFMWFCKIVFGFIGAVLGIVGVVLIGALLMFLFFAIFNPSVINGFAPEIFTNWALVTPEKMVMLIISLILVVGCPVFILIYWAIRIVSGRRDHSRTTSLVVFILWLAGLFMFCSVGANTLIHLRNKNGHPFSISWCDDDSTLSNEVRDCNHFDAIEVSGNIELILTNDSLQQITVSAPENCLSKVITNVENGVLHIYSNEIFMNRTIKVNVPADSIRGILAKGACQITCDSDLVTPEFKLGLMGACQADMALNIIGLCDVDIKGASKVRLIGSSQTIKVNALGASEIDATGLIAKQAEVYVAGASHAKLYATESIDAKAYGASEIDCKGSPKKVSKSDAGASSINIE